MKKIMITMFGILAAAPVSLLSATSASANPYPGYVPPPWVRPPAMPPVPMQHPRLRYIPMAPRAGSPRFRAAPMPVPMARPMRRPMPAPVIAQRRGPAVPPAPFRYNRGWTPAPALAARNPYPANRIARAPMPPRAMPGSGPGYARMAPGPAWRPAWPVARQVLPARHFYPGLSNFRPQYRFAGAPVQSRFWKPVPARTQTSRYFRPPVTQHDPRRIARVAVSPRGPAAAPTRRMARQNGSAFPSAPVQRTNAWPPRYSGNVAPNRYSATPGGFRPYQSATNRQPPSRYGARPVSYSYGRY